MSGGILLFGGTSEGSELAAFCESRGIETTVFVATEYGASLQKEALSGNTAVSIEVGRLSEAEIEERMRLNAPRLVIDATHPYAVEISENVRLAAKRCGISLLRVLRGASSEQGDILVPDAKAAAERLVFEFSGKRIFLATGSKELQVFLEAGLPPELFFARILPDSEALKKALSIGLLKKNLICMQGPFSEELNLALFRELSIDCLVTKDAGARGGFPEKLRAARRAKLTTIVIARPEETDGITVEECKSYLEKEWANDFSSSELERMER